MSRRRPYPRETTVYGYRSVLKVSERIVSMEDLIFKGYVVVIVVLVLLCVIAEVERAIERWRSSRRPWRPPMPK
jgi:hypothetical protein